MAFTQFGELPLTLEMMRTSPGSAWLLSCRTKTSSKEKSLPSAVIQATLSANESTLNGRATTPEAPLPRSVAK